MSFEVTAFLRVGGYNMGGNSVDWLDTTKRDNRESDYNQLQSEAAERLKTEAAVYCLQEVYDVKNPSLLVQKAERPLIATLRNNHFEIHHAPGKPMDCVVAISTQVFKNIQNHSCRLGVTQEDAAIVSATHRGTGQRVVFVSAHAPGCDLEETVDEKDAKAGDDYCRLIAEKLSEIGNCSIQIIGIDINACPEKWQRRFDQFLGKSFVLHRTSQPTSIKPSSIKYRERELDYLFSRTFQRPRTWFEFFRMKFRHEFDICQLQTFKENPSDHEPVFGILTIHGQSSAFTKLKSGPWGLVMYAVSGLALAVLLRLVRDVFLKRGQRAIV